MASYPDLLEDRISHLPPRKRRELALVAKILFEEFQQAQSSRNKKILRNGRILKLVLFGSYARGSWVEDRASGYFSDYDLLVIVSKEDFTEPEFWRHAEERIDREWLVTKRIKTPVEPIYHSYEDVNGQIAMGRPFFLDILRDGIVLYEAEGYPFSKPGRMTPAQKHEEAQRYFDEWYALSLSGLKAAKFCLSESHSSMDASMRDAVFLAHQATERIYHCFLLTLTLYSPKMHNIKKLRSLAEAVVPELADIWPRNKRMYKRAFELLRRAYVEARYSPEYEITREELEWVFERIELLQHKVKEICEAHLQQSATVPPRTMT
ncbi:MAG: Putative nucleotidyltransferase [Candidatus Tokpelaia hoelldobleri]|uniref:Nucleotidyltransferase n=1 Tax=Candidatus Tokpelaia hoelldobleri TaxID=1902579 RepID=A0A1U9JTU5_9HYPH|nr:MAG: Putative nucleotidyltransferase [Candidatus Tokpelaia hoelldoblerii]